MRTKAQQQGIEYENFVYNNLCQKSSHTNILRESQIAKRYNNIKKFDFLITNNKDSLHMLIQCKHYKSKLPENEVLAIIKKYEDILLELKSKDNVQPQNCIVIIDVNYGLTRNGYNQINKHNQKLRNDYNIKNNILNFIYCTDPIREKNIQLQYNKLIETIDNVIQINKYTHNDRDVISKDDCIDNYSIANNHINTSNPNSTNNHNNEDSFETMCFDMPTVEDELKEINTDILNYSVDVVTLDEHNSKINEYEHDIETYKKSVNDYKNRVNSLKNSIVSQDTIIKNLHSIISHKNDVIYNHENAITNYENRMHYLEDKLNCKRNIIKEKSSMLLNKNNVINDHKNTIVYLQDNIKHNNTDIRTNYSMLSGENVVINGDTTKSNNQSSIHEVNNIEIQNPTESYYENNIRFNNIKQYLRKLGTNTVIIFSILFSFCILCLCLFVYYTLL